MFYLFGLKEMNAIEQIIDESIKIAKKNSDILELIKLKSKDLMIEDLFEITKVFVSRKGKNVALGFTLENFQKTDPEGYFSKVVKGFCKALIDIGQTELSEEEKHIILNILNNRKSFKENTEKNEQADK